MSTPFVLPQYQGSYYDLQRQQALAQALMQGALTQQQPAQAAAVGPYQVQARMSPIAPLSQLAQGLLAAKTGQQASQGLNNLGQQQWGSLVSMLGGGNGQSPQPNPDSAAVGGVGGSTANPFAGSDGGGGSAGAGAGPVPVSAAGPAGPNVGVGGGGSPLNPLGMNPGLAAYAMMQAPDKYFEAQMAAYKPADIVASMRAAGIDPNSALGHQIAQSAIAKSNYIAPTEGRPGGWTIYPNGQRIWNPNIQQGGMPALDANGQPTGGVVPQPGAADVTGQMAAAKAGGEGSMLPYAGVDVRGNPMPVTNRTAAATQAGATTPASAAIVQTESGGNPNAVSPKGALGAWQVMPNTNANPGFGVMPAQNNSRAELDRVGQDYYNAMTNRYGSPTIGAIAYNMGPGATDRWIAGGGQFERLPAETQKYVGKVSTLTALNSGAGAPAQGQSPQGAASAPAPARPGGGPIYAAPPMGATAAANASQGAPSDLMKNSYASLSGTDSNYQASRQALQTMIGLAQNTSVADTASRFIPEQAATRLNATAAEYEKQYANYVSMQGKALGGESSGGTDQSRGMLANSVPGWDKPQAAKLSGLNTQLQQLDMNHLKTQFLTPVYQKGDEKTYTAQSAAFDQNIKPTMMPILQMSGPQQQAAVQAAIKANPALRPSFEWAFNNGMLK